MPPIPINWLFGALILAVACVFGGLVFGYIIGLKTYRTLRWPSERARRLQLERAIADVERCDRITEGGYCDLLITFAPSDPGHYRVGEGRRLRATVLLPREAIDQATEQKTVPIRFDPLVMTTVFVDHEPLLADRSEAFERREYIDRGLPRWKLV